MTNPAGVPCQLIGVGYPEVANKMAEALRLFGTHHAIIVHSDDGMDELSLGSDTAGWEVLDGEIRPYVVRPRDLGLPHATLKTSVAAIRRPTPKPCAASYLERGVPFATLSC